jgi:hypothetical protein
MNTKRGAKYLYQASEIEKTEAIRYSWPTCISQMYWHFSVITTSVCLADCQYPATGNNVAAGKSDHLRSECHPTGRALTSCDLIFRPGSEVHTPHSFTFANIRSSERQQVAINQVTTSGLAMLRNWALVRNSRPLRDLSLLLLASSRHILQNFTFSF